MLKAIAIILVALGSLPLATADDVPCSETLPCETGCCGTNKICGLGPDYCSPEKCINNCDAKAECNPGDWPPQYTSATTCPLNVCCSSYGFCGTNDLFCGNTTVPRPSCDADSHAIKRVIGYYNSAAASRSCGGMTPLDIPQGVYTHLYFAFGSIDPNTFEVIPASPGDEQLYPELVALQSRDLGQQLWLSIGGWDFTDAGTPTATTFSDLAAADASKQDDFFKSLILFMNTYGFTGVDIDWEYPAADDRNGRAEDFKNFPIFLANLKKALDNYKFGLSVTLPTSYWYLQHFDLVAIEPSVDWFNYMSYDLHGTWDIGSQWTGAYLNAHTNLTEIKDTLDLLWRNNVDPSKVTMGMAFYGRSFTLASSSCSEPGCSYLSAGDAGDCSATAGILFNNEIEQIIADNKLTPTLYKDAAVKTITWNGDQWVSFDDEDTWKLKADFAKSECLGGVLVWSIDNDDDQSTYSKGLAKALGNEINVDLSTGQTLNYPGSSDSAHLSELQPYCRFINCGEICPNGFTTVVRDDEKSQLMLDSTECPPGSTGTQTLCCPTSTKVPTCRWRGFNGGKCSGGCTDNEAEVGTVSAGCRSGYQSACCTITASINPWWQCQWTSTCNNDKTCPSGYPEFLVSSREGWGGRPTCSSGKSYNYCCSGHSIPDPFTNCKWVGHEVDLPNKLYCTDSCPSGEIRIAEQGISTLWGADQTANTKDCLFGREAYCCSGKPDQIVVPRGVGPVVDRTLEEFDSLVKKFLADPVCPSGWDSQYSASLTTRDLLSTRTTDQSKTLSLLLPLLAAWITSPYPRKDYAYKWDSNLVEYGYGSAGANASVLIDGLYGYTDSWTGAPIYSPMTLLSETLCNIAASSDGLESLATSSETLCVIPDDSSANTISSRALSMVSMNDRSENQDEPTISLAIHGIMDGDLSLHYMRWLNTQGNDGNEVTLELAFWIGPVPGVAPSSSLRSTYGDRSHTAATDRWVVVHLHILVDQDTILGGEDRWVVGIRAMTFYHGQTIVRPRRVQPGTTSDYRVQWVYGGSYAQGGDNYGPMENYNARTEALNCNDPETRTFVGSRMYMGGTPRRTLPSGYTTLVHQFSTWLVNQGIFATGVLTRIWPDLSREGPAIGWPTPYRFDMRGAFNPVNDAFNRNFMPDGSDAPDLSHADP